MSYQVHITSTAEHDIMRVPLHGTPYEKKKK